MATKIATISPSSASSTGSWVSPLNVLYDDNNTTYSTYTGNIYTGDLIVTFDLLSKIPSGSKISTIRVYTKVLQGLKKVD